MTPFTDEEIYEAVENNLDKVSSYVSSHGGSITLIHPELNVVNVDGLTGNELPDDVYVKESKEEEIYASQRESVFDKVKNFLHI